MRVSKKWFAIFLSALLLLGQVTGALAADFRTVEDAVNDGREASYKAQILWNSPVFVDAETNELLAKLFESISFEGRYAQTGENTGYSANSLKISGQDAITFDTVTEEDAAYLASSLFGSPIGMDVEDAKQFLLNLGAYMDAMMEAQGETMGTLPSESFEAAYAQIIESLEAMEENSETAYTKLEDMTPEEIDAYVVGLYEAYGLGEAMQAALDWTEANMQPEEVEGPMDSVLEIETASSLVYELNKAQLVELFDMLIPMIMESETYWENVIALYNSQRPDGEPEMTLEDIQESLPEAQDAILEAMREIPDDMEFRVRGGYDAAGEVAVYQVELLVPGQEDGDGELIGYAEWVPAGMPLYAEFFIDGEGGVLMVVSKEEEEDKGFSAVFEAMSAGEVAGQILVESTSIAREQENRRFWDGAFSVMIVDDTMEMGVQFVANSVETTDGDDASLWGMFKADVLMMGETVPLITATLTTETAEPQGPSFDVGSAAVVYPGQMTEEEFATFMNEDVMVGVMQSVMTVVSLLPQEVLAVIMGDMGAAPVETTEALEAPVEEAEPEAPAEEPAEETVEEPAVEEAPANEQSAKETTEAK